MSFVIQTFCNKHSADVVEITSEAENKFVAELVKRKGGELFTLEKLL